MSVETGTGNGPETGLRWGGPAATARAGRRESSRRRLSLDIAAGMRGPSVCLRRDALFRRALLAADVVAILGALVLTVALSSRRVPLHLTWESLVGVPLLLVGAKLLGLYDRDETLLRKTTLDEAPKLFQLATLCTLVALLAGRLVVAGDARPQRGAVLVDRRSRPHCCSRARPRAPSRCGPARPSAACSSATNAPPRWWRASSPVTAASRRRSSPISSSTRSRRGRPTLSRRRG